MGRRARCLAVVVAALAAVGGCGSDDGAGSTAPATTAPGSTEVSAADGSDTTVEPTTGTTAGTDATGGDTTTGDADSDTTAGDTAGASEAGGGIGDGCQIVTAADAEAVLGEPVQQKPREGPGEQVLLAACSWGVDTPSSFKLLQLLIFDGPQFFSPDAYRAEESFEQLEGLGDEAFLVELLGLQVQVLDGDRTISLDVSGFNVDDPEFNRENIRQALLDLAEQVLERS